MRGIARVALAGGWVAAGGLAVAFFAAQSDVESGNEPARGLASPTAVSLDQAARVSIERGIAALGDERVESPLRFEAYRRAMEAASSLLIRSLHANPVQPAVWARLAAIRWEQEPPSSEEETAAILRLVGHASSMAGRIPEVQVQLGTLLLRMGRRDEAAPYFRRAVLLDPRVAGDAVGSLSEALADPDSVFDLLPAVPEVLIALRRPYLDANRADAYLARLERVLHEGNPSVLRTYVDAAVGAGSSTRARLALESLAAFPVAEVEATRLAQLSRAARADGDPAAAVEFARRASSLAPDDPYVAQGEGLARLAAGDEAGALSALRRAVNSAARTGAGTRFRASLYADLGRAEEASGRPDRAYDQYRRALDLDPEAAFPLRRMEAMRRSAGAR